MIDANELEEFIEKTKGIYSHPEQYNVVLNRWIEDKQKEEHKQQERCELRRRLEAMCSYYIDLSKVSTGITDFSAIEDTMRELLDRLNEVK